MATAPAAAQAPAAADTIPPVHQRIAGPSPMAPALLPAGASAGAPLGTHSDTLPCLECNPPKRFWLGAADVMLAQFVPWAGNYFISKQAWAEIGPQTWRNNLTYPWQWDDNTLDINHFRHPVHGSMYFNAARTNGYSFWGSAAWPLAGSLMWELFWEAWAPSPNDLVNTSVGGVILGETLFRLSRLTLDNTATGGERVWREIGSALLNPISGFNRLVRGETGRVSANPPAWRPSAILGVLDLGYRQTTQSITNGVTESGSDQWNATFLLSYGDPTKDLSQTPFSYFAIRADLAGPSSGQVVNQFSARGSLAAWPLGESRRHQVAVSLEYDYFDNPAFQYAGQSVQVGLISSIGAPRKTWWGQTTFLFNGVILGSTKSDYYRTVEGRNYDYGPGLGTLLSGRLFYKTRLQGTVSYAGLWLHTIDGTQSAHYQDALLLEARYWASHTIGIGFGYTVYNRHSDYSSLPDVDQSSSFLRAFVSTAIPGLPH